MSRLRVLVRDLRVFVGLFVVALFMVIRCLAMSLGCVFVMLGCLAMCFVCHRILCFRDDLPQHRLFSPRRTWLQSQMKLWWIFGERNAEKVPGYSDYRPPTTSGCRAPGKLLE
jgi:hypothetical protein